MGDLVRNLVILVFWIVVVALVVAAIDSDARDVIEDYVPGFAMLDPVVDWMEDFFSDLWDAITD